MTFLAGVPLGLASLVAGQQRPLQEVSASAGKLSLTHDLIGFHKSLVEIESITDNEKEVGDWLADSLQSQGYTVEKQFISKDPERFNVLAWPGTKRDAKLLVSSHIDTVSETPHHVIDYMSSHDLSFSCE